MYGSLTREHHRDGCHYLAELLSDRAPIAIEGARHNGPFTHPEPSPRSIRDLEARRRDSADGSRRRRRRAVGTEQRGPPGDGDLLAEERARSCPASAAGVDRVRTSSAQSVSSARCDQASPAMASRITTVSTFLTTSLTTHTASRASNTATATVHKLAFLAVSKSNARTVSTQSS